MSLKAQQSARRGRALTAFLSPPPVTFHSLCTLPASALITLKLVLNMLAHCLPLLSLLIYKINELICKVFVSLNMLYSYKCDHFLNLFNVSFYF